MPSDDYLCGAGWGAGARADGVDVDAWTGEAPAGYRLDFPVLSSLTSWLCRVWVLLSGRLGIMVLARVSVAINRMAVSLHVCNSGFEDIPTIRTCLNGMISSRWNTSLRAM